MSQTIQLGDVELRVVAQPHAYLLPKLSEVGAHLFGDSGPTDGGTLIAALGDGVYDALAAFIPDLPKKLPAYEFHGYPSKEAWQNQEYDEEAALKSPTIPQIGVALEVCIEENGGDFLRKLFAVVDPKLLRALISERLIEAMDSMDSASLPPTSGEFTPTSSGESPQTLGTPNGSASPSRV